MIRVGDLSVGEYRRIDVRTSSGNVLEIRRAEIVESNGKKRLIGRVKENGIIFKKTQSFAEPTEIISHKKEKNKPT